jgi:putative transposase
MPHRKTCKRYDNPGEAHALTFSCFRRVPWLHGTPGSHANRAISTVIFITPVEQCMPHRKTCKRYDNPGEAHALTFSCFRRQAFLSKDGSRQWLVDAIDKARRRLSFHVWAYVIMPEHAHLLVWPTQPEYRISKVLKSIKKSVANRALAFVRHNAADFLPFMEDRQPNGTTHYRFWQRGGGYDRNVFESFTVFQQIEYIHNNPVRRGLCLRPEDWLWSGAADYAGLRAGPLRLDRESLPMIVTS